MQTVDTNSAYFARFCFSLGMQLKRIEVIADDEDEIIETTRRMSKNYDFVVTSGGIGPTYVIFPIPIPCVGIRILIPRRKDTMI